MRTISFFNLKGGSGKTTISTNIAYALAESWDARVLFIDNDKQGNSSSWFFDTNISTNIAYALAETKNLSDVFLNGATASEIIQKTRYTKIDVITSDMRLIDANFSVIQNTARQDDILKKALAEVEDLYDICIIDNPPDINMSVFNAFVITDDVIIVTDPSKYSLDGLKITAEEIKKARAFNPKLTIRGVLVNKFQSTQTGFKCLNRLQKESFPVFKTRLHMARTTKDALDSAAEDQKSIYEVSPGSLFARDLIKFIEELLG